MSGQQKSSQKVSHEVKKCVMMSKSVSCCQNVSWRQNVHYGVIKHNIRHDVKKFVTSKICHKHAMMSKSSS